MPWGCSVRRELVLIRRKEHDAASEPPEFCSERQIVPLGPTSSHGMHHFHGQTTLQPARRCSCGSRAGSFLGFSLSIVIIPWHPLHLLPGLSDAIPVLSPLL